MSDVKFTVYKLVIPNGKQYVGMTRQKLQYRWNNGKAYWQNKELFEDINAFGWDNIEHIIVAENLPIQEAKELEKKLIKDLDLKNPQKGYNKTIGGDTALKYATEEEALQARRDSNRAWHKNNPEKAREKEKKYRHTEAGRASNRKTKQKYFSDPEKQEHRREYQREWRRKRKEKQRSLDDQIESGAGGDST